MSTAICCSLRGVWGCTLSCVSWSIPSFVRIGRADCFGSLVRVFHALRGQSRPDCLGQRWQGAFFYRPWWAMCASKTRQTGWTGCSQSSVGSCASIHVFDRLRHPLAYVNFRRPEAASFWMRWLIDMIVRGVSCKCQKTSNEGANASTAFPMVPLRRTRCLLLGISPFAAVLLRA